MPDDTTITGDGTTATQPVTGGSPIVIIPPEVEQQFPDIIDLIRKSESMNNEERQYWVDILLVMTPEQVQQLREILTNERDQLAAIDAKYAKEIDAIGTKDVEQTDETRRQKREELTSKESAARSEEDAQAEDILKQME